MTAAKDPIAAVLGPGGLFARALDGYEHRPQQVDMARAVLRAFQERRYALVEAGTGTGKTLAYLLPAILSGRRVVVSTATKTLQEQIVLKDLPQLHQATALEFSATVMKGRSNYLCLERLERAQRDPHFTLATRQDAKAWDLIRSWVAETEVGDKAELDLPEGLSVWRDLSSTSETCLGQRCPLYESCFVTKMRRRAAESDLLIVNHHLFFADLALKADAGGGKGAEVIPSYDAVVFDEAHALEDVATEFFGVGASDYRIDDLVRDTTRALGEADDAPDVDRLLDKLEHVAGGLFGTVRRLMPNRGESSMRLNHEAAQALRDRADELQDALLALKASLGSVEEPDVQAMARRAVEISRDVEFLVSANKPGFVYWAEARTKATFLRAAPIDVAEELRQRLYARVDTAVFTSATLATQGKLDFVKRRLGLSDAETGQDLYSVDSLVLDSPFDFRNQAVLYVPARMPDAADPRFVAEAAEEIDRLCEITGGRAFALFTSLRNMTEAHRLLRDRLPFRVLLQGERPKHVLLAEFKEKPSVLFAAHSFWEGVDVAGDALSLVIIDKLPFASPGDPVVAARVELLKQRGHDAFGEYQVPQAALTLRQGFGRLVRTRKDRGVVAILDRRLATKSYGKSFLDSLPPCPRTSDRAVVEAWWKRSGRVG